MTTGQRTGPRPPDLGDPPLVRQEQLCRLVLLRRAAEHQGTARFLERRAERAASPVLAALLRERAAERRRRGERLLADLPEARPTPRGVPR